MKSKQYTLQHIAEIRAGCPFRERLEADAAGTIRVIQLKDLSDRNIVDFSNAVRIYMPAPSESYFLHKGDLVFRSRGYITTAALMTEDADDVILAAPFLRIRIHDRTLVLPDYLNWYISTKPAQRYFTARQAGTSVNMVAAGELAALPVPVPPLSVQQQIVDVAGLAEKEYRLETELMQKRKKYTEALLLEQAGGGERHKEHNQ
ncbi:MAG TPA: hypothetical protein DCL73_10355 [Treponema sp.]|nr:hypothetical protein [Treponema sp.]